MKRLILLIAAIWCVAVWSSAQGFGYSYSAGREDVQMQTPIAAAGADCPDDIWAVSGNLQPFGTCANNANTPQKNGSSYAGRRLAPPTTGGGNPTNPDVYLPIGDIDWVCGLLLIAYTMGMLIRRQRKAKKHNQPLCD